MIYLIVMNKTNLSIMYTLAQAPFYVGIWFW